MEETRLAREREIQMMMVARSQAIEEEEEERAMLEAERRLALSMFVGKESRVFFVLGTSLVIWSKYACFNFWALG